MKSPVLSFFCLNPLRLCLLITMELGWQPISPSGLPVSDFPFSTDITGMHTAMSSFSHGYWRSEPRNSDFSANALTHWAISTILNTIYQSIFSLDTLASAKISDDGRHCFLADVFLAIFTPPRMTATIQGMRKLSKFRTLMTGKQESSRRLVLRKYSFGFLQQNRDRCHKAHRPGELVMFHGRSMMYQTGLWKRLCGLDEIITSLITFFFSW